jgi:hypothetical protein
LFFFFFISRLAAEAHLTPMYYIPPLFLSVERPERECNHSPLMSWLRICDSWPPCPTHLQGVDLGLWFTLRFRRCVWQIEWSLLI